jgi:hypothetical protein
VVNIQTRKITDGLASLVKQIDSLVDDAGKRGAATKHAFVVLISNDPDEAESTLEEFSKKTEIKNIPLTVFDGVAGPRGYKIAKDAEVTVMLWVNARVSVNLAFGEGELDDDAVAKVVAAAKEHLR